MAYIVAILQLLLNPVGNKRLRFISLKRFLYYFLRCFAVAYYILMIYILFFSKRRQHNFNYRSVANFELIYHKYVIYNSDRLLANAGPAHFFINLLGNVFIFIPFVATMEILSSKKVTDLRKILIILSASICIESMQYIFNIGVFDVDDILLNLIGGLIGLYLSKLIKNKY
jgi:glycopeptide antibiotics resistance protein